MSLAQIKPIETPEPPENEGTVTSVVYQKKDPNRCSIFLDETFAFGLHVDVVTAHGLRKGVVLSRDACVVMFQEDVYHRALKRVLSHLAYKPRTEKELRDRLRRLRVDASTSDQVLEKVRAMQLVNDDLYARAFAESRLRSYGPRRVVRELVQKGIPAPSAENVVAACNPHDDSDEHMDLVVAKAHARYGRETDDRKRSQKTIRYLIRRGYELEDIQAALGRLAR